MSTSMLDNHSLPCNKGEIFPIDHGYLDILPMERIIEFN